MKINKLLESKKIKEDASYEWKPNTSFKHIKDIYNKVKANDYKYVNNEREEFMAAVKKADSKGYKPEECRQIKEWHRDIWQHNRKTESWTDDHQDIMARKTSGYDKCYRVVKKARSAKPVDTKALNDARDHFGYDLYKMCLDDVRKELGEAFEKDGGPFWYFTKHGLGPGMLPKGVNVVDTKEDDNFGTYVALDKVLTTQELKDYELTEKRPDMEESVDFSRYEKSVESFLNKYGFTEERYPHIINSYNNTEEHVVTVSFNDGIGAKDFGVMKKHLGDLGADIYLANRHKDYSKENELWSTVEFEFANRKNESKSIKTFGAKGKKLNEDNELSNEQSIESVVDAIKAFYENGGFKKLPVGRKNAFTVDIYGPDKERLVGYFKKQNEFNYEINDESNIISHEFISDKYDVEIFDSFVKMYKIPQNESLSESIDDTFKVGDTFDYTGLYGGSQHCEVLKVNDDSIECKVTWTSEDDGKDVIDATTFKLDTDSEGKQCAIVWEYQGEKGRVYPNNKVNEDIDYSQFRDIPELLSIEVIPDNKKWQYSVGGKDVPYTSYEDAKAHLKDDYNIEDYREELQAYLDKETGRPQKFFVDATFDGRLVISIHWGDWKHEHNYADFLVRKFFMDKGLGIETDVDVTEEDGSDTYSAEHYYQINDIALSGRVVEEAVEDVQYGVHQFSTDSIIFRGTEEECGKYIDKNKKLWDDAEVYRMTPDDPHYKKMNEAKDVPLYIIKDSKGNQLSAPNPDDSELWDRVESMEARGRRGLMVVAYTGKKVNEASYGGAFDIEDDQYFTKDDLLNFADEVLGNVAETFDGTYDIGGVWFEDGNVTTQIVDTEGNMFEDITKVDMRKIREPWHLKRAYALQVSANIIKQIKELNAMDEAVVPSTYEFDDDIDDLSYYYDDEIFKDNLENNPYTEVASKSVLDTDGFSTDYTMYMNVEDGGFVFIFGDKDVYNPGNTDPDWECETKGEAWDWFNNYEGFNEEDDDFPYWMSDDEVEQ